MRNVKNEQGYALVIVLLIITVFMIIFLSFSGQAFNSVKQNQVVEKKSLSVTAAETGVSYYQVEIQRIFESKQQKISDEIKNNILLQAGFKTQAAIKLAKELNDTLGNPQPEIPINGDPNASFSIKEFNAIPPDPKTNSSKVNISLKVVGTENKKTSTLSVNMTIDLDSIVNISTIDDINNYKLPTFKTIEVDPNVNCATLNCGKKVYINGDGEFPGNNNLTDGQTIFTTGSLNLEGNGNENAMSDLQIHTDGDITIHKNMNSASNTVIESKGNATFWQNLKMQGSSKLLIMKYLHVYSILGLNNSFAYVGGTNFPPNSTTTTATIDKTLDLSSFSKMCVNGDLNANKINLDSSSKLLVLGKVNGAIHPDYTVDNNTFIKECGTFIPPDFQIKWGDNVNTVIDNVTY